MKSISGNAVAEKEVNINEISEVPKAGNAAGTERRANGKSGRRIAHIRKRRTHEVCKTLACAEAIPLDDSSKFYVTIDH